MAPAQTLHTHTDGSNNNNTTASKLLFTLLQTNSSQPASVEVYEDPDFIPNFNVDTDKYFSLQHLLNQSKVISDAPPYLGYWNTPLSVREPDLVLGSNSTYFDSNLLGSSNTKELAWLIPAVVAAIFIFFLIAYACFYGVRALELKVTNCCLTFWCCCGGRGGAETGEERAALTASMAQHATEMKAYQSHLANREFPTELL